MAAFIKTNGEITNVTPKNGTDYKYEELKEFVGGYIEIVPINDHEIMVVNEEGKLNNLPVNYIASLLYKYDAICGNVLVCDDSEVL